MRHYPEPLVRLIQHLKKLPGVGSRSAERFAFHMLEWSQKDRTSLGALLGTLHEEIVFCKDCGCLLDKEDCSLCARTSETLCVVAHFKDVYSIENTHEFKGHYHVLGGVLSPLEGKGPERLTIPSLLARIERLHIREVVIALDSTLEGDATSLYLKQQLETLHIQVSRLAFGLPMGSSLDYVDGGTLARALSGRRGF